MVMGAGRSLGEGEQEDGAVRAAFDRAPELIVLGCPRCTVPGQAGVATLAEALGSGVDKPINVGPPQVADVIAESETDQMTVAVGTEIVGREGGGSGSDTPSYFWGFAVVRA